MSEMASASKIAANRRNAQKSTGPRSIDGKARTCRNAFRHGLAIPITRDIFNADVVDQLARQLIDKAATPAGQEHAQLAAEAETEILRVRQAKVDLLNREAQRLNIADANLRTPDDIMATAFAAKLEDLSVLERYERRTLSKRNRALRAVTAARRANDARRRDVFLEPVERLNVTAVVEAALVHSPHPRYSELAGWSGETYGAALDLRSAGLLRADAFVQCQDAAAGGMRVHMTYEGNESVVQDFAIAKRSAGVGGGQWIAICPTTGQPVANLYMRTGARGVKSRFALNLHYRSKRRGADQERRAKRRYKTDSSAAMAEYTAIVAAITGQANPNVCMELGTTPTLPRATYDGDRKGGPWPAKARDIAQHKDKVCQRARPSAQPHRRTRHRPHKQD